MAWDDAMFHRRAVDADHSINDEDEVLDGF
jgi:hypothetical protein